MMPRKIPGVVLWPVMLRTIAAFSVVSLLPSLVGAQPAPPLRQIMRELDRVVRFHDAQISPGGKRVAWITERGIYAANANGSAPMRITACPGGKCEENGIAWSPNGAQLAFLSDAAVKGQMQAYVAALGKSARARRLTTYKGFVQSLRWSPDGKTVAALYTENAEKKAGPVEALAPLIGVIDTKLYSQRIALIDAATGHSRLLTPNGLYIYEYDWSPSGDAIVYTAAPPPGDDNWYIARLYTIDVRSRHSAELYRPQWQIAEPRWSPDGARIAFIEGLMSDEGSTGGDILTIPARGGTPHVWLEGRHSSPSSVHWNSRDSILFTENISGENAVSLLELNTGRAETLSRGPEQLQFSGTRAASAVIRSSWAHAPEVWTGPAGDWKQVTHTNAAAHPAWGEAKSITWTNDGLQVQGWLVFPQHYSAGARYPMVVSVHGGPAGMVRPSWPSGQFNLSLLASRGYFVFFPNPRGSFGQGEAFTRANIKDFGGGDLRDILAGVDAVTRQYPIDPQRVGIGGWSYGGYMTMWTVTQTHRFRTAVAGAGIADWRSYYGENAIDQWMIPYFGASIYDDPAVYAKSAPLTYIKTVKTPTLVLVGERDGECPFPQSQEFWHALKTFHVPTELVVYPGEGHRFHDPEHILDLMERTVAWYDRYLKPPQQVGQAVLLPVHRAAIR